MGSLSPQALRIPQPSAPTGWYYRSLVDAVEGTEHQGLLAELKLVVGELGLLIDGAASDPEQHR